MPWLVFILNDGCKAPYHPGNLPRVCRDARSSMVTRLEARTSLLEVEGGGEGQAGMGRVYMLWRSHPKRDTPDALMRRDATLL